MTINKMIWPYETDLFRPGGKIVGPTGRKKQTAPVRPAAAVRPSENINSRAVCFLTIWLSANSPELRSVNVKLAAADSQISRTRAAETLRVYER